MLQGVYSLLVAETITQQFGNTIGKMGSGSRQHGDKSVNKEVISVILTFILVSCLVNKKSVTRSLSEGAFFSSLICINKGHGVGHNTTV